MTRAGSLQPDLRTVGFAVAVGSVLSLALGYGRELLIAQQLGASRETDAFFIAYFTPQVVYQLLIAGPLVWALTPLFAKVRLQESARRHDQLAGSLLTVAAVMLVPLTAGWMIFSGQVARAIAPSYSGGAHELTAQLTQIMAPQLVTYGVGAVLTAVLYSRGRVFLPVLAQLVNNAVVLALIVLLSPRFGIKGVAIAVVLASGAYFVMLVAAVATSGTLIRPRLPRVRVHARELVTGVAPLIAIGLLSQTPGFAERAFASSLPGGELASISYGYRLLQVALAAIGAVATVAFVGLVGHAALKDETAFRARAAESLRINVKFALLAMGALTVLAPQIVHVAYSSGRISGADEHIIVVTTALAAVGLPLVAAIGALQQPLFAMSRWRPLAALTTFYVAVAIPASAILIATAGSLGFVAANVLALLASATAYLFYSWRRYGLQASTFGRDLARVAAATAAASGAALMLNRAWASDLDRPEAALALGGGLVTYAVVALSVLVAVRDAEGLAFVEASHRWLHVILGVRPRPSTDS